MPKTLVPDFVFDTFADITVEFLKKQNVKALLCDVDNTLSPYEHAEPNDAVRAWIGEMQQGGIKIALVSNNNYERINTYNKEMKLVAYADAGKPSRKCYFKAAKDIGVDIADCAVLGDQLLTDCWSARRLGIKCFIVPPIKDKRDLFHRFKRAVEKPFMLAYKKKNK
ncbi:MAG: YqeG family HAD IIIA-type phosphatase [Ruminococcaceae bacterium]|nr:YqeG family HAD IIIA-type phosphatase [Oscillospiraceae bacterium]